VKVWIIGILVVLAIPIVLAGIALLALLTQTKGGSRWE